MTLLTGDFDYVLEVQQQVISSIVQAMHRENVFRHRYMRYHNGKAVELQIGAPTVSLDSGAYPENRAWVTSRVYYHSRPINNPSDIGINAVADVRAAASFALSTGNPGLLTREAALISDWSNTAIDIVTVYGATSDVENEVRGAILEFINDDAGGAFTIPPFGDSGGAIGSVGFRFLNSGSPVLTVGLNSTSQVKGSTSELTQVFVQQDFALAISGDYLMGMIISAIRSSFGGNLPPPNGPNSVEVWVGKVCTISTPFGCWAHATQHVILDALNIALAQGQISVSGRVTIHTDAWYVPEVIADFTLPITLSVGADQSIQVNVGEATVSLEEWWAQIANFLSGNNLASAIATGVQSAVQSGSQGQFSTILSPDALGRLGSLGSTTLIQVNPVANAVEIRTDGIIIHGSVNIGNRFGGLQVSFADILVPGFPNRHLLHAGNSWAPGSIIDTYSWDFGDGQTAVFSGQNAQFVAQHDYSPSANCNPCLSATDAYGSVVTVCKFASGTLVLHKVPEIIRGNPSEWDVCLKIAPFVAEFYVLLGDQPVSDATITVSGQAGWQVSGNTDSSGRVRLILDPKKFFSFDGGGDGPFSESYVTTTAHKSGFVPVSRDLTMLNCVILNKFGELASHHFEDMQNKIHDLERLRKLTLKSTSSMPTVIADPVVQKAAEVSAAFDAGMRVFQLVEAGLGGSLIATLLGMDPKKNLPEQIIQRLDEFSHAASTLMAKSLDAIKLEAVAKSKREQKMQASGSAERSSQEHPSERKRNRSDFR